jgi:probable F420-dependent oxidoreductase
MRSYADGLPTLTMGLTNFAPAPQDWGGLLGRARLADEAGIDRIIVVDHVVMGEHIEHYDGGRFPTGPDGQWLEPMTTMAVIAGMTTNVRMSTGIILAGLRRPVVFAKAAATLDVLSGGRLDLGVGVGWQKEEYDAAGLDFAERGRLLDQTLELCRRFWTESPVDYRSDGLAFERIWCEPKPLQPGGVPIWVSGRLNKNVLNRLVRHGDGWIPWGEWSNDVVHGVEVIRAAFADAGRDWDGFEIRGTLRAVTRDDGTLDLDATMADVPAMVAAGITDFTAYLQLPADDDNAARDQLTGLVQAFRATVGRK